MDDVEQLIVNQLRRTDRAIKARRDRLKEAEQPDKGRTFNRRYVLEFSFDNTLYNGGSVSTFNRLILPQVRSFVVDRDCKRFYCQELVATMLVVGSPSSESGFPAPPAQKYTLPPIGCFQAMSYTWRVRDTSTDRDWSDSPLPSTYVQQSNVGGYRLPSWALLEPGTELQVTLAPTFAALSIPTIASVLSKIEVNFSFIGFEVL